MTAGSRRARQERGASRSARPLSPRRYLRPQGPTRPRRLRTTRRARQTPRRGDARRLSLRERSFRKASRFRTARRSRRRRTARGGKTPSSRRVEAATRGRVLRREDATRVVVFVSFVFRRRAATKRPRAPRRPSSFSPRRFRVRAASGSRKTSRQPSPGPARVAEPTWARDVSRARAGTERASRGTTASWRAARAPR